MADPRIPRPPGQPPPLPPRPIVPEPFVLLNAEPAPDTVRTRRDEMLPPEPLPLSEETGYLLRQEMVLLREALPTKADTLSPPSKRQQAARAVSDVAKWTTLAIGVLGVAVQVAAMFRPDLVGPLQTLLKLLGGAP